MCALKNLLMKNLVLAIFCGFLLMVSCDSIQSEKQKFNKKVEKANKYNDAYPNLKPFLEEEKELAELHMSQASTIINEEKKIEAMKKVNSVFTDGVTGKIGIIESLLEDISLKQKRIKGFRFPEIELNNATIVSDRAVNEVKLAKENLNIKVENREEAIVEIDKIVKSLEQIDGELKKIIEIRLHEEKKNKKQ